jgi:NhaP-type Na+/H+ or K+/H+ antiporter
VEPTDLAIIAAFIVVYSMFSHRLSSLALTGPMAFVAFGLLVSPTVFDIVDLQAANGTLRTFAELTLVLVLFTDAARIDIRTLSNNLVPARLLGIGLPLTIALGAVLAALLFDELTLWEVILVAVVLAPTDAALGSAVISNRAVPSRIRQSLNVESGLNDGIASPLVSIGIIGAVSAAGLGAGEGLRLAGEQLLFGSLVGVGIGLAAGFALDHSSRRHWINPTYQNISMLVTALLAFWLAEVFEGNGFIAAFLAGLTVGTVNKHLSDGLFEFAEEEGQLLTLVTFMIFGGAFLGPRLDQLTWEVALFAVLSLTAVRMLPVAISQIGVGFRFNTVAFLGWFGPRGLASIVFGLLVLEESEIAGADLIFLLVTWTVLFSVFAHGISAAPVARRYGRRAEVWAEADPDCAEMEEVDELRVRVPHFEATPEPGVLARFVGGAEQPPTDE